MYAGQIVEDALAKDILSKPRHWYTAALVASARSAAIASKRLPVIPGAPPQLNSRPAGCRFAPRCANAKPACAGPAALATQADGRRLRCHFPRGDA
jgi:peptide/nickel transport system ATP-binding protein